MKLLLTIAFTGIILCSLNLAAQTNNDAKTTGIEDEIENSAESLNESGQNEIPEELLNLVNHPVDINTDNMEIFGRFNLLSHVQIEAFGMYRKRMGNLVELEELQQVDGFDKKTIMAILPYITIHNLKFEKTSHQLTIRIQKSLNKTEYYYPGSEMKILFRYQSTISNRLKFSFTGEKDAGEEFFSRNKKGFDFNSFNITYTGNSLLNKIILGDYNLEFGQGINTWTGLSFSSGANVTGIFKSGRKLIPYSGTDENRFFHGIAINLKNKKINSTTWFSYHGIDGNRVTDTLSNTEFITSLQTSGYHRTYSEKLDFHSQQESAFGSDLTYTSGIFSTGATFSYQHFKIPIGENDKPYAKHKFTGQNNFNTGIYYSVNFKNIIIFGESCLDKNYSAAIVHGMLISIDPKIAIGILYRNYSGEYVSLKSNAYGANSDNSNEKGIYTGMNYKISRTIIFTGYTDIYSFPFLKYRVDKPSSGFDFSGKVEYTPVKKFSGQFRYRKKLKQQNDLSEIPGLNPLSDFLYDSYRVGARFKIDNTWEYGFRAELSIEKINGLKSGSGTMISQDLFFHPMGKAYSLNFRYAIFNCPEFNTRIYEYENDVQGAFSIPFYYGSGNRFYVNATLKIKPAINISLRYAISWIDSESTTEKSDIKIQAKMYIR